MSESTDWKVRSSRHSDALTQSINRSINQSRSSFVQRTSEASTSTKRNKNTHKNNETNKQWATKRNAVGAGFSVGESLERERERERESLEKSEREVLRVSECAEVSSAILSRHSVSLHFNKAMVHCLKTYLLWFYISNLCHPQPPT